MSDAPYTLDLSPDRIARLPKWAIVALVSRSALRILPAFLPDEGRPRTVRATALRSAYAGCLIGIVNAVQGDARYKEIADVVTEDLNAELTTPAGPAKDCLLFAKLIVFSSSSDVLQQNTSTFFLQYAAVASKHSTQALLTAAREDVEAIETLGLGEGGQLGRMVPSEYFARPLITPSGKIPEAWEPVVSRWGSVLDSLELSALRAAYLERTIGAPLNLEDMAGTINKVARPAPPPPEAPTKEPATVANANQAIATDTPANPPDVWMLSDRPLEKDQSGRFPDDRLHFEAYANALATILDHEKTGTPFTMAINAPWGAGKTTLANMIVAELELRSKDSGRAPHIICRFNAWMHDDAANLATAFVSEVSRTADRHRRPFWRVLSPMPSAMLEPNTRRRRRLAFGAVAVGLVVLTSSWISGHLGHVERRKAYDTRRLTAYQTTDTVTKDAAGKEALHSVSETLTLSRPSVPPPEQPGVVDVVDPMLELLQSRMVAVGAFFTAIAGLIGVLAKILSATPLSGYVTDPMKAAESGAVQSAETQLKSMIEQATWRGNRFLVIVDDIERCKPPRAVDVLDAVNQLMDHKNVLTVFLGDMSAVAAAAQLKYKDLAEIYSPNAGIAVTGPDQGKEAFGRLYLQKIIQFQFDLPIPPKSKIQEYMTRLTQTPAAAEAGNV